MADTISPTPYIKFFQMPVPFTEIWSTVNNKGIIPTVQEKLRFYLTFIISEI